MNRLKANIVTSVVGQGWAMAVSILCTPFLIKLLGAEAYGLIAFFFLLQSLLQILDLGMGPLLNREIARNVAADAPQSERIKLATFVVTMERWYWLLGAAVGMLLLVIAPWIVSFWIRPVQLAAEEINRSAHLIAVLACIQWASAFYQNGLQGMQRQVELNMFQIFFGSLNAIGGVIFVWLGPRSVSALLAWQCLVTLVQMLAMARLFWRHTDFPRIRLRPDFRTLRGKWGFSLGMSGIAITGLIITHLDKVILSRLLTLESFGHYNLAGTMARALYLLTTPLFNAYYPRFSALVSEGNDEAMRMSYHSAAQLMAAMILPLAMIIAAFPQKLAFLWLHDMQIAAQVGPIATLLVIGTCLNGLMVVPFALQLAYGKTKIGFYINVGLVLILVPSIIFSVASFGAIGGAAMWAVANGLYLLVGVPLTHKYLLKGEATAWVQSDFLPPLVAGFLVVGAGRLAMPSELGVVATLIALTALWLLATACAVMSAARIRAWIRQIVVARLGHRFS